ncbi:MAG: hypothetical protein Q9219_006908 [cf. Caloplaca sp. 3 TL-2023]
MVHLHTLPLPRAPSTATHTIAILAQNSCSASSSRAAITHPLPLTSTSPRASSHAPTLTQQPTRSRRTLAPNEHFNAPLRPHVPKASSSSKPSSRPKRTWTRSALEKERREFFETRVTGREEVWGSLKLAVELLREGDVEDAQGVLDASGVTVPTGDIVDGVYDEQGGLYQLPAWVVAEPEKVVEDDTKELKEEVDEENRDEGEEEVGREKGKEALSTNDGVKVKCRLSDRGGPDVVIIMGRTDKVGELIKKVQREANLPGKGRIRIAYLGKILKDGETLEAQGWGQGHVINALVFPRSGD